MRLSGKVAIVTGGAAGIGKGVALRLAEEGADIVIADIDKAAAQETATKIEALGRRTLIVQVDISRKEQIEAMVAEASELGRIDILVNNAGIEYITPLLEVSEAEWDRTLTINLKGMFLCSQAVARVMIADQGGGKIVNLGSVAAVTPPKREPHYAASKGGVHALTKQLALELAEYRINVNAVAPGSIRNGLSTRHSLADAERAEQVRQSIPWGRVGTPQDVANAVLFLASDEADYITGVVLPVDGGILLRLR
jgi:NAD(P)-dependent dehydrogenase (short-subunit alcohol dehydrogenase family)